MIRFLALSLFALTLSACGPEVIFSAETELPSAGWAYADSLRFDFTVPDTTRAYDLILNVEHTEDFPYENFYIKLHTLFPSGKRTTEQLSLQLAGDFGEFLGDCSGRRCAMEIPILSNARFAEAGDYALTVKQFSRDEPLREVTGLGLAIVVAE